MFKNPGKSLKTFATILFWIIISAGMLFGIMIFAYSGDPLLVVLSMLGLGLVALIIAYLICVSIYSFGELVENSTAIRKRLESMDSSNEQSSITSKK